MNSTSDAPSPGEPPRTAFPGWLRIALATAVAAALPAALLVGFWQAVLVIVVLLLITEYVLDYVLGFDTGLTVLLVRIAVSLAVTVVMVPFCLVWPGDNGVSHRETVRARLQSIGRMWCDYWQL